MDAITERILRKIGIRDLPERLCALGAADFNSLLLRLFSARTAALSPQRVLRAFRENRFAAPGSCDPIRLHRLELELLSRAAEAGITNQLLSPVAPLGCCSVFGCVSQNNVLSAVRSTEVLADPCNLLALLLADDLLAGRIDPAGCTHYASAARVVRGQPFRGSVLYPHFGLFCIVSTARDRGSYLRERELLTRHLRFYDGLLRERCPGGLSVTLRRRGGYPAGEDFFAAMCAAVRADFPHIPVSAEPDGGDNGYYRGINFKICARKDGEAFEVADGGFVDWISRTTGDRRDRCLISGLGLERLLSLPEAEGGPAA